MQVMGLPGPQRAPAAELVPVLAGTVIAPSAGRDADPARWNQPDALELAVRKWLAAYESPHTRAAYRRDFDRWTAWCESRGAHPGTARRADVDDWRRMLTDRGESAATVARRLAAVSSFYIYWLTEDAITRNPAERSRRPKVSAEPGSIFLTHRQAADLLGYVATLDDLRPGVIVRLLAETGMRVGELCGARVADLMPVGEHHVLAVVRKGGERQQLPVARGTLGRVREYLGGRQDGWLLEVRATARRRGDGQMDRSYVRRMLRRISREAGLPDEVWQRMHPHVLRHSAATLLAADKVPPHEIQRLLGHASLSTTQRYIHHAEDLDNSPVYKLAALYAT